MPRPLWEATYPYAPRFAGPVLRQKPFCCHPRPRTIHAERFRVLLPALKPAVLGTDPHVLNYVDPVVVSEPVNLTGMAGQHGLLSVEDVGDVHVFLGDKADSHDGVHEKNRGYHREKLAVAVFVMVGVFVTVGVDVTVAVLVRVAVGVLVD